MKFESAVGQLKSFNSIVSSYRFELSKVGKTSLREHKLFEHENKRLGHNTKNKHETESVLIVYSGKQLKAVLVENLIKTNSRH